MALTLLAMLDMGWQQFKVAAEYDGDQHRTDRRQYVKDIRPHPDVGAEGLDCHPRDRRGPRRRRHRPGFAHRCHWRRAAGSPNAPPAVRGAAALPRRGPAAATRRPLEPSSRSASAGLRARQGPCMYDATMLPCTAPSIPSPDRLPAPFVTAPSGLADEPRTVPPRWFSIP